MKKCHYGASMLCNPGSDTEIKDGDITKTVKQNMKTFESYCERFPIFIPRLMMFKSFLEQLNDSSKAKGGSKAREFSIKYV